MPNRERYGRLIATDSTLFCVHLPAGNPPQREAAVEVLDWLDYYFEHKWTIMGQANWLSNENVARNQSGHIELMPIVHGDWAGPGGVESDHHIVFTSHVSRVSQEEAADRASDIEDFAFAYYLRSDPKGTADRVRSRTYQRLIWVEFSLSTHVHRQRDEAAFRSLESSLRARSGQPR